MAQAQSKLHNGTLFSFLRDSPLQPRTVEIGLCKLNCLLIASHLCLTAAKKPLDHFVEHNISYSSSANITKQELLKILSVVNFPIELLTHACIESFSSKLLVQQNEPIMRVCGTHVCRFINLCTMPLIIAMQLFQLYTVLPRITSVKELCKLSRPTMLTEALLIKAVLKFTSITNLAIKHPLCEVDDQIPTYMTFIMLLEVDSHPIVISNAFWHDALKDDQLASVFLGFLERWMEIRSLTGDDDQGVESTTPMLCLGFIRALNLTSWQVHKPALGFLSNSKSLKTMYKVAKEMFDFSKGNSSLSDTERADICMAATSFLAFRVYIISKESSTILSNQVTMPQPAELLEALTPLGPAWVQCAHCFINSKSSRFDSYNALAIVVDCALGEASQKVLDVYLQQIQPYSSTSERMLMAIFTAQESISTIIAIGAWILSTYSQDEDFITSKKALYDPIKVASKVNKVLCNITKKNVYVGRYPKTNVEMCEAGLKAVEAASNALIWAGKMPPRQILDIARRHPNHRIPSFEKADISHPTQSLLPDLHRAVYDILKGALMCSQYYGDIPGGDPSSQIAKKIGAATLKAFFAMESTPQEDWTSFIGLNFTNIKNQSYVSMPGIVMDPNPRLPYERPNSVFTTAIAPILATREPWLENAVRFNADPHIFAFRMQPPQAYGYCLRAQKTVEDAMKDVDEGGELQKKRAVARAYAMAMLQCGNVGCHAMLLPEQKSKLCSGCKVVRYCSEKCLKADWKKNHKIACKAIAAGRG
jgi:MYND finger